jgi:diguanylate cyclase
VSWTVVLGPLFADQETGPLTQAIVLAYPLGDLAILLCMLMLILREAESRPATVLLVSGLSAIAIADSGYLALTVYGAYHTGNPVEVLWFAGMIALALAAMLDPAPAATTVSPESTEVGRVWRFLVPAVLVGVAGVVVWADPLLREGRWADPGQVALALGWVLLVVRSIRGYRDAILAHQYERLSGEEAQRLALRDPLTQVANRRAFESALDDCVARARAGGGSFGLAFVDADRLKAYNDTHGHVAGDAALRELAADLVKEAGPRDVVARIGGDEFALLMLDADVPELSVREECLRYRLGGQRALRASVGFSIWLPSMQSPSELLEAADRQLYTAKRRDPAALVS